MGKSSAIGLRVVREGAFPRLDLRRLGAVTIGAKETDRLNRYIRAWHRLQRPE